MAASALSSTSSATGGLPDRPDVAASSAGCVKAVLKASTDGGRLQEVAAEAIATSPRIQQERDSDESQQQVSQAVRSNRLTQ